MIKCLPSIFQLTWHKKPSLFSDASFLRQHREVKPSIEMAAAIAEALEVSLDYLVGNTDLLLEKNVVNKIIDIQKLGTEDKAHVFAMLDAFLQSQKAKKVFAS